MPKLRLCQSGSAVAKRIDAAEFVCAAAMSETVSFHPPARCMYHRFNGRDTDFIKKHLSEAQKSALAKARTSKQAISSAQIANAEGVEAV